MMYQHSQINGERAPKQQTHLINKGRNIILFPLGLVLCWPRKLF